MQGPLGKNGTAMACKQCGLEQLPCDEHHRTSDSLATLTCIIWNYYGKRHNYHSLYKVIVLKGEYKINQKSCQVNRYEVT